MSEHTVILYLTTRPPPRPTLFPYRRSSDLRPHGDVGHHGPAAHAALAHARRPGWRQRRGPHDAQASLHLDERADRSEEHTSELQSRRDLVCRLLLEKKKYFLSFSIQI